MDTIIELGWVVSAIADLVLPIVAAILTGLAAWLSRLVADWLRARTLAVDEELEASWRDALDTGIRLGLDYARGTLTGWTQSGGLTLDVRHELIATAVRYVREGYPGILAYFEIDDGRLTRLVMARLEAALEFDFDGDGIIGEAQAADPAPTTLAVAA